MLATKQIALHRPEMLTRNQSRLILFAAALLIAATPIAQAQPLILPLPPFEQKAVDNAIEHGVQFLKRTQRKTGTWAKPGEKQPVGYAVLPGLTLLECGVPANDPLIQKTAQYLRSKRAFLNTTYDLSLGILFLDRVGDPKDKKLIQTFALRLIAGQSMTGGWGYKCPLLPETTEKELLIALRHLDPLQRQPLPPGGKPGLNPIAGKPGDKPGLNPIAGKPGDNLGLNPIAGKPGLDGGVADRRPGGLAPIAQAIGGLPLEGIAALAGSSALSGGTAGGNSGTPPPTGGTAGGRSDSAHAPLDSLPGPRHRWRDCLGVSTFERIDPWPLDNDGEAKENKKDEKDSPAEKPYVIPKRLRSLTVIQDPDLQDLWDPKDMKDEIIVTTTDNSNTQFAILALWAAQRYDVPMNRTLHRIVRRYLTSQNIDGSWGYHYSFGGNCWTRPNTMTCVGLIGLAVAHGLAQPGPAGQVVRDPRIINGLIALYKNVGQPVEQLTLLPMQNLYFLWSLERVAVLYNLPILGDKDWYRWGAQVLVVNQQPKGNWANGGYPAAHPLPDTCFALLFLKRSNLAKDLAAKLPFNAADLNDGIMDRRAPSPRTLEIPPAPKTAPPAVEPPKPAPPPTEPSIVGARSSFDGTTVDTTDSETGSKNDSGGKRKWIVLCVVVFVILATASTYFFFGIAKRRAEAQDEKHKEPKARKKNRKLPSTA